MIYRQDIVKALKLKGEGSFPHFNTSVEFGGWIVERLKVKPPTSAFCTIDTDRLTEATWQNHLRKCDRVFLPGGSCNGFVVVGIGRGAIVRMGRIKLPGIHLRLGPPK